MIHNTNTFSKFSIIQNRSISENNTIIIGDRNFKSYKITGFENIVGQITTDWKYEIRTHWYSRAIVPDAGCNTSYNQLGENILIQSKSAANSI